MLLGWVRERVGFGAERSDGRLAVRGGHPTPEQIGPVAATLAVGDGAPRELALSNAWPNPAQGRASFTLELPQASMIELAVHDLQGRAVWRQAARSLGAGRWTLDWPGTDASGSRAAAGVYLARVRVDGQEFTRRFVLLK